MLVLSFSYSLSVDILHSLLHLVIFLRTLIFFRLISMAEKMASNKAVQSALCFPESQATIKYLHLSKQTFTFCLPFIKHILGTPGDLLIRAALFLDLFWFNYSNEFIAGSKSTLVAAVCDGLEQLAICAAGRDGLE